MAGASAFPALLPHLCAAVSGVDAGVWGFLCSQAGSEPSDPGLASALFELNFDFAAGLRLDFLLEWMLVQMTHDSMLRDCNAR